MDSGERVHSAPLFCVVSQIAVASSWISSDFQQQNKLNIGQNKVNISLDKLSIFGVYF